MNKTNCEDFLMAMMARLDGEEAEISAEQTAIHLEECGDCSREFAQMQNADSLLKRQVRREKAADLWSAIDERIQIETAAKTDWQPFLIFGAFLVAYKLVEILPESDFGFALKIVPVIVVVALFAFLRKNPFKINTELILEK